jgi:signal transduction histidine kinase
VALIRIKAALLPFVIAGLLLIPALGCWAARVQNHAVRFDGSAGPAGIRVKVMPSAEGSSIALLVNWPGSRRWETNKGQPAGTELFYQQMGFWERNRPSILVALGAFIALSLLLGRLMVETGKRRVAESALKDVSRYLIGTAEQERRRIARELHDDVNQKMALLSIELDRLQSDIAFSHPALRERLSHLLRDANAISSDISRVSHELHSSALEFLGLVPALRRLCRDFSEHHDTHVAFKAAEATGVISPELSLCLFRIAQECLTNVARHSGARSVDVQLMRQGIHGLQLTVIDDGRGFDASKVDEKGGLGIISMRERLRLVGGHLTLRTAPSEGTYVAAWAPVPKPLAMNEPSPAAPAADSELTAKTRARKIS